MIHFPPEIAQENLESWRELYFQTHPIIREVHEVLRDQQRAMTSREIHEQLAHIPVSTIWYYLAKLETLKVVARERQSGKDRWKLT